MTEFQYQEMFPLEKDETEYRLLSSEFITRASFDGHDVIKIDSRALTLLAEEAFRDVSHLLRPAHLEKVAAILEDPGASECLTAPRSILINSESRIRGSVCCRSLRASPSRMLSR